MSYNNNSRLIYEHWQNLKKKKSCFSNSGNRTYVRESLLLLLEAVRAHTDHCWMSFGILVCSYHVTDVNKLCCFLYWQQSDMTMWSIRYFFIHSNDHCLYLMATKISHFSSCSDPIIIDLRTNSFKSLEYKTSPTGLLRSFLVDLVRSLVTVIPNSDHCRK